MYRLLNEDFQVHDELNSKIWDDSILRPEVREQILKIVDTFKDYFSTPISIVDIIICGSNASYNYTENSDLDVHIIANFDNIACNISLVQALYDLEKSKFNSDFSISIHGVEIELYIQDVNSGVESNGIYSVIENKWIKVPKKITEVPHYDLTQELEAWTVKINEVIFRKNKDEIESLINQLYNIRKNSIANDGEYGRGNQLFKELRSNGLLGQLKDAQKELLAKSLTLENLTINEMLNSLD